MLGNQNRWQEDLFVAGSLSTLIPDDHILRQVDNILDLSWLRNEVRDLYDTRQGRPSIDPEAAVRLMLAMLTVKIMPTLKRKISTRLFRRKKKITIPSVFRSGFLNMMTKIRSLNVLAARH